MCTESLDYPGYYEIPGYSNYVVSMDGVVINRTAGWIVNGSRNPAGYHNYRLATNDGTTMTLGRHRLMAIVFKPIESDICGMVVNHKNGIKGDDWLDNLEWVAPRGNVEHAGDLGITDKCTPIEVRDVDTGAIYKYPSMAECARVMGVTKDNIAHRLRAGSSRVFPERRQYRLATDVDDWVVHGDISRALLKNGTKKTIDVRYLLSDTVVTFTSMTALSIHLNVSQSAISHWMDYPNQPVLPGLIQLKWGHDAAPWREVLDCFAEIDGFGGHSVVKCLNTVTGVVNVYTTAQACASDRGLLKTTLNYRLNNAANPVYSDGYQYRYYKDSF